MQSTSGLNSVNRQETGGEGAIRITLKSLEGLHRFFNDFRMATLPSPNELPMRYAVVAVRVLQWQGQSTLVVDYAYRMLRARHFECHRVSINGATDQGSGRPRSKAVVCHATTLDLSAKLRGQSLQVVISRDCISNVFTVVFASQQRPADKGSQIFFRPRSLLDNRLR
jgi:hypothetical protein